MSKFVHTVHTNFHAKSGGCSSKNGWVFALGTKENTYILLYSSSSSSSISSVDNTVQTFSSLVRKFGQKRFPSLTDKNLVVRNPLNRIIDELHKDSIIIIIDKLLTIKWQ